MTDNIENKNEVLIESDLSGTFAERLASAINAGPDRARKFANRAGIPYSTIHNYLINISIPTLDNLVKLAEATDTDVRWLATGKGAMKEGFESRLKQEMGALDTLGRAVNLNEFYFVPRYGLNASAGHGSVVDNEAPAQSMAFRKSWIDNTLQINPKGLAVLGVKGDSMEPVINDRDVLLINTYDNSLRDGIYVLRSDNDLIVKRIQKLLTGTIEIISANPAYKTMTLNINSLPDDFSVIGRVLWFGRTIP